MTHLQFAGGLLVAGAAASLTCLMLLRAGLRAAASWCVFANIVFLGWVLAAACDWVITAGQANASWIVTGLMVIAIWLAAGGFIARRRNRAAAAEFLLDGAWLTIIAQISVALWGWFA